LDERRPDVIVLGAGVMGLTTGVCLAERGALPANERQALYNAIAKLQAIGPALGYQEQFHRSTGGDMPYRWGS